MLMFLCGLWTGTVIGFGSHIALMEMKRIRRIHYLLNLPKPTEREMEIFATWADNNRKMNIEQRRNQIKIVKE